MIKASTMRTGTVIRLILVLLIVGFPFAAIARDGIVSVQSISISPYEEAIDGFATVCSLPMERLLTSEKHSVPIVEQIRRKEPELILAVGLDALTALEEIQEIPIVYVMLLCPECELTSRQNVTGVNMTSSMDVQLGTIHDMLPEVRRIGVVFDPEKTGTLVDNASAAASPFGIDILSAPVAAAREVPTKLSDLRDQAQMIWMLPDVTVTTRQTMEFFLLFSMENRIPLIAFSEKYVDMGAFMAFGLDPEDMGRQAGALANSILSGKSPAEVPIEDARSVSVTVNRTLVKKFGVQLDETQREAVKFVE